MNQHQAPRGLVATLGHRANDNLIVKGRDGWRYVDSGQLVDDEDFRSGWDDTTKPDAESGRVAVEALRAYAEFADEKYEADPSDYNSGRADAATEAINRVKIATRFTDPAPRETGDES